jgi:hypothetical protein
MRRFGAILLVLAALVLAAGPVQAQDRLDRIKAGLAKDPVFLDPDLYGALTPGQIGALESSVRSAASALGRPVYLTLIPNPMDSESGGDADRLLWNIHQRVGRDGLYLTVDEGGYIDSLVYRVPRLIEAVPWEIEAPGDVHRGFADVPARLARYLAQAESAAVTDPSVPSSPYTLPTGTPAPSRSHAGWDWASFYGGLIVLGPVGALLLYGIGIAALKIARIGRTPAADLTGEGGIEAPARPKAGWARDTGAAELKHLGRALDEHPHNKGRAYALAAYDAAQLLAQTTERDPTLDLVGSIVLARLGRVALLEETGKPAPPCFVNPLHGPSTGRQALQLPDLPNPRKLRPVCRRCAESPGEVLRDAKGRAHYVVPGIWRDTGFGALVPELPPRVLEHLGVD